MKFNYKKFKDFRYNICTQDELADKSGISVSIIKNIESGRKKVNETDEYLIQICSILDTNINEYFEKSTKTIVFFNNKGGVGKTSLVSSLASVMVAEMGKHILMVDCDQQMNLTMNFGMEGSSNLNELNVFQAIVNNESAEKHIRNTGYEGLDILISHYDMGTLEPLAAEIPYKESRFASVLKEAKESGRYDYIFCDTSPILSSTNNIIINGCDGIIIPFTPDPFALGGIGNVMDYIKKIQDAKKIAPIKSDLEILGIVVNKYDKRVNMSSAITEVVEKLYSKEGYVFETKLPEDISVRKCQGKKQPLSVEFSKSKIHECLVEFAKEVDKRAEKI